MFLFLFQTQPPTGVSIFYLIGNFDAIFQLIHKCKDKEPDFFNKITIILLVALVILFDTAYMLVFIHQKVTRLKLHYYLNKIETYKMIE